MNARTILLKNGLIQIPEAVTNKKLSVSIVGTLFSNLAYYGYILSKDATAKLIRMTDEQVADWWGKTEKVLKEITGENKKMDLYVVYKNFPQEVLDMTLSEYWVKQILMYIGFPNEYFTETEVARDKMFEAVKLKVLQSASDNSLRDIYRGLLKNPARWTDEQFEFVQHLVLNKDFALEVKFIPFKENLMRILAKVLEKGVDVEISSATDVLRLGVGVSDGDLTFKTNTKFKSFPRGYRRFFLDKLEHSTNLEEDVARDTERWKKFLFALHPKDYRQFKRVNETYVKLCGDELTTFNSVIEELIILEDEKVLDMLQARPGDFVRRLHHLIEVFGDKTVEAFIQVIPKLKTIQLLKIQKYIDTIGDRRYLTIAPKGNWAKLKVVENQKQDIGKKFKASILSHIDAELHCRLNKHFKEGILLDGRVQDVKLQTSDSDLLPYGRGTTFYIPENIKFIRSASYWKNKDFGRGGYCNLWYDNGWNFFDANWKALGSVCWISVDFMGKSAIFSGDPTSSKTVDGNACQMIDLYPDRLLDKGVRYAVWNILCYNNVPFESSEVYAALQWGQDAQKGKLFEPSRCQMSFPLKGSSKTKYIAYIDLKERQLVYMDANLKGSVNSATANQGTLQTVMPAYVEYLGTLPSVHDLFVNVKRSVKGTPVLYDDDHVAVKNKAYVFRPTNKENKYTQLVVADYL